MIFTWVVKKWLNLRFVMIHNFKELPVKNKFSKCVMT